MIIVIWKNNLPVPFLTTIKPQGLCALNSIYYSKSGRPKGFDALLKAKVGYAFTLPKSKNNALPPPPATLNF